VIYLLDTDHVSALQNAGEANRRLTVRLKQIAPDDYGTTIVTFEEQMRGRLAQINTSPSVPLYAALNSTLRFYQNIAVWQYTEEAERQVTAMQQAKIRIGTQDLKIASIALTVQATLLTRNTKDFAKVPRLRIEDWTS
jgi:tRNA(fMet)-specific endonuclease VapC